MIVFLIILGALIAVGLPLYLLHKRDEARQPGAPSSAHNSQGGDPGALSGVAPAAAEAAEAELPPSDIEVDSEVCCGMHITCEKDSLLATVSEAPEYYDDEELDRYAGRSADQYTPDEIEEFRDILLTLIPTDIAPWARSIQLRGITLPTEVRDELLLIVAEARAAKTS